MQEMESGETTLEVILITSTKKKRITRNVSTYNQYRV
jgi:hypothetical protein